MPFIPSKKYFDKYNRQTQPYYFKFMSNTCLMFSCCSISASYELTSAKCTAKYSLIVYKIIIPIQYHLYRGGLEVTAVMTSNGFPQCPGSNPGRGKAENEEPGMLESLKVT